MGQPDQHQPERAHQQSAIPTRKLIEAPLGTGFPGLPEFPNLAQEPQVPGVGLENGVKEVADQGDGAEGRVEQDVRRHPRGDHRGTR